MRQKKNFTNVVADDDDDWDAEDEPGTASKVNKRDSNGMAFYNRAPLNADPPTRQIQPQRHQNQGMGQPQQRKN